MFKKWIAILALIGLQAMAEDSERAALPAPILRMQQPLLLGVTFGDPAPAWFGLTAAYQFSPTLQIIASAGRFWADEITIHAFSVGARFHILETELTPFLGAGGNLLMFSGTGNFRDLDSSTFLPYMSLGLDWIFEIGCRVSAGVSFHFPIKLTFPFVDLGISF